MLVLAAMIVGSVKGFSSTTTTTRIAPRRHDASSNKRIIRLNAHDRRSFLGSSASVATAITTGVATASPMAADAVEPSPSSTAPSPSAGEAADSTMTPRIVLWGYGNQNQLMAKYLAESKLEVVSVISRHDIGDDYGLVSSAAWGTIVGAPTGIKIVDEDSAAAELARTRPNVCILSTRSTLADIRPALTVCAQAHVNVLTIAEEVLDSRTSSPKLTREMDQLFRANGVTLMGSGFIDGACCEMTMVMASMMQNIQGLKGRLKYDVDLYGTVLSNAHGVGLTPKEFAKFAKAPGR